MDRQPTMVEAFIAGFIGAILCFIGVIAFVIGLIAFLFQGDIAPLCLIGGTGLIVLGSYLKFSSAHSVRNVR